MSKIIMDAFKFDSTISDNNAINVSQIFWHDKSNNVLKIGNKVLNYYVDSSNKKILTLMTQAEATALGNGYTIKPIEYTINTPV